MLIHNWAILVVVSLFAFSTQATDIKENNAIEVAVKQASEAAPEHIVKNASFMRFAHGKFNIIKAGTNDFTCLVVHEPNGRYEPSCFNKPAMKSVFFSYQMHMKYLYMGYDAKQTHQKLVQAFQLGELPKPETGSLVYMMSRNNRNYVHHTKTLRKGVPHQMYFYPKLADETFSLGGHSSKHWPALWQGFPAMSALIVPVQ
ncbi:chromate transporter [Paraglaciecola sp. 2405UD69-4]|uniref:chromate transporter n=1 Tax=Paraglaciecola sp. 2405UD69-4 TaxID=3391836 RepID=UPI0039C9BC07